MDITLLDYRSVLVVLHTEHIILLNSLVRILKSHIRYENVVPVGILLVNNGVKNLV